MVCNPSSRSHPSGVFLSFSPDDANGSMAVQLSVGYTLIFYVTIFSLKFQFSFPNMTKLQPALHPVDALFLLTPPFLSVELTEENELRVVQT